MKVCALRMGSVGTLAHLIVASGLLLIGGYADAATYDECMGLYEKSNVVPGTPNCAINVAGNTPVNTGSYNCPNAGDWINDYCGGATSKPGDSCPVADPVSPTRGSVTLTESDFRSGDAVPLTFTRTYLSSPFLKSAKTMGPMWLNNWQRQLSVAGYGGGSSQVTAYRANGQPLTFQLTGGQWKTTSFSEFGLAQIGTGWTLTDLTSDTVESYSAQGVLLSETTHTGFTRTLAYDGAGRLTSITQHAAGALAKYDLKIALAYDSQGRLYSMTDPAGGITQYGYDPNGNLLSVTWPDGYVRRYVYDAPGFNNGLTGVVDETGSRIATWTYDAKLRATSVTHPDTTRNVQFAYGAGSTTMSSADGTGTTNFELIAGILRMTGGSTADGIETRTLDAAGNVIQKTAPNGSAAYSYDAAGRPVRAAVGGASGTVITSVRYADATSLHPSLVATPGKMRAFVYDAGGNVTGYSEFDTSDTTGVSGFDATSTGNKLTVGARYDSNNRLLAATVYTNGVKTEDWIYFYDATGNIQTAQDLVSNWLFGTQDRDAANRATWLTGNYREARLVYDKRGRVGRFTYNEDATALTAGVKRFLTVDYSYTPDGRVASRTGTVARNGGTAQAITSDEIDQWISNYETGADPVGPPANLSGALNTSKASTPATITPICSECYVFSKAKLAWKLFYRGFNVTETGQPVHGDVPELQIAEQEQVPFPILMPEQNGQSKRAVLYAQLFRSDANDDSGVVKCAYGQPITKRCRDVKERCINKCHLLFQTPDYGIQFFRCMNSCMADNGC